MKVLQAFRYELDPNHRQRTWLFKHAGAARFAWNWGLSERIRRFQENNGKERFPNAIEQHRELNLRKKTDFPWMYEVSKCALQEALRDLDRAFQNFRRERKKGNGKAGFPKWRKKGRDDHFRLTGSIRVEPKGVVLPRIRFVRTKESTAKFEGRVLSATVSREADRWFVSILVECERPDPSPVNGPVVGVDLGLEAFAVISGEPPVESPKPLKKHLQRLRRLSRRHSRKQRGSQTAGNPRFGWRGFTGGSGTSAGTSCTTSRRGWQKPSRSSSWRTCLYRAWSATAAWPGPFRTRAGRSSGGCWNIRLRGTARGWSLRRGIFLRRGGARGAAMSVRNSNWMSASSGVNPAGSPQAGMKTRQKISSGTASSVGTSTPVEIGSAAERPPPPACGGTPPYTGEGGRSTSTRSMKQEADTICPVWDKWVSSAERLPYSRFDGAPLFCGRGGDGHGGRRGHTIESDQRPGEGTCVHGPLGPGEP